MKNFKRNIYRLSTGDCDFTATAVEVPVPVVPCNGLSTAGGYQVHDDYVTLDPSGGVIVFLFDPQGFVDKMEFYHGLPQDNGVNKVSTTSQSATGTFGNNYGPFDNVWGTPPTNNLPNDINFPLDQFIGTNKGTVLTRQTVYTNDTGFTIPSMTVGSTTYKQVIWWTYTAADFSINNIVTIRVTGGASGTAWSSIRVCPTPITTTTTTTINTTICYSYQSAPYDEFFNITYIDCNGVQQSGSDYCTSVICRYEVCARSIVSSTETMNIIGTCSPTTTTTTTATPITTTTTTTATTPTVPYTISTDIVSITAYPGDAYQQYITTTTVTVNSTTTFRTKLTVSAGPAAAYGYSDTFGNIVITGANTGDFITSANQTLSPGVYTGTFGVRVEQGTTSSYRSAWFKIEAV